MRPLHCLEAWVKCGKGIKEGLGGVLDFSRGWSTKRLGRSTGALGDGTWGSVASSGGVRPTCLGACHCLPA